MSSNESRSAFSDPRNTTNDDSAIDTASQKMLVREQSGKALKASFNASVRYRQALSQKHQHGAARRDMAGVWYQQTSNSHQRKQLSSTKLKALRHSIRASLNASPTVHQTMQPTEFVFLRAQPLPRTSQGNFRRGKAHLMFHLTKNETTLPTANCMQRHSSNLFILHPANHHSRTKILLPLLHD